MKPMLALLLFLTLTQACGTHRPRWSGTTPPPPPVPEPDIAPPAPRRDAAAASSPASPLPAQPAPGIQPAPSNADAVSLSVINARLEDAFFDYDQHSLREDARAALRHNASLLRDAMLTFRGLRVTVEGHCDERGSAEYNLALGDLRARAAREFLSLNGIDGARLEVISYGRERPQCVEVSETCWQKNRRAHLTVAEPRPGGEISSTSRPDRTETPGAPPQSAGPRSAAAAAGTNSSGQ